MNCPLSPSEVRASLDSKADAAAASLPRRSTKNRRANLRAPQGNSRTEQPLSQLREQLISIKQGIQIEPTAR
jgi:hypothetical protein